MSNVEVKELSAISGQKKVSYFFERERNEDADVGESAVGGAGCLFT